MSEAGEAIDGGWRGVLLNRLLVEIPKLRDQFWSDVSVVGSQGTLNQCLERAGTPIPSASRTTDNDSFWRVGMASSLSQALPACPATAVAVLLFHRRWRWWNCLLLRFQRRN